MIMKIFVEQAKNGWLVSVNSNGLAYGEAKYVYRDLSEISLPLIVQEITNNKIYGNHWGGKAIGLSPEMKTMQERPSELVRAQTPMVENNKGGMMEIDPNTEVIE
jgi:hypothetical protein